MQQDQKIQQEISIEEMALIAKSVGYELKLKLFNTLIENKNRDIHVFELSKITGSSYRNVQIHLQFFVNAGLAKINPESYPMTVRISKSVHFFEKTVMDAKKEGIDTLVVHESLALYTRGIEGYKEITDEEEIIRIAKGLSNPTRIYIMQILYNQPGSSIPKIEKLLRGTQYESSYRNVSQHIDKLEEAGIVSVIKDQLAREKLVDLKKIIKIETRDIS